MLDKAIEMMGDGYMSHGQIVEDVTRKYGLSPADVVEEKERRKETLDNLQIIMDCLTDRQKQVLSLTGQGYTFREMEEELGIDFKTCCEIRQSIPKRLFRVADEDRIKELEKQIEKTKKKGRKFETLIEEYEQRISVREALKKLLVLLTPPQSKREIDGGYSDGKYIFESLMNVGVGMRDGIENGYHIKKTVTECRVPEYLAEQFGDNKTCCMLCTTCRRNKDVVGRCSGSRGGIWHTEDVA